MSYRKVTTGHIADEIALVIIVMKLVNSSVLAKVSKASEKLTPPWKLITLVVGLRLDRQPLVHEPRMARYP